LQKGFFFSFVFYFTSSSTSITPSSGSFSAFFSISLPSCYFSRLLVSPSLLSWSSSFFFEFLFEVRDLKEERRKEQGNEIGEREEVITIPRVEGS
jgi:hypothetical protein